MKEANPNAEVHFTSKSPLISHSTCSSLKYTGLLCPPLPIILVVSFLPFSASLTKLISPPRAIVD